MQIKISSTVIILISPKEMSESGERQWYSNIMIHKEVLRCQKKKMIIITHKLKIVKLSTEGIRFVMLVNN